MENHAMSDVDKCRRKDVIDEMKCAREDENISSTKIDLWMTSQDIVIMGALWDLILSDPQVFAKITLLPWRDEMDDFAIRYFGRCLIEDPKSKWTATRYEAARTIIGWFDNDEENLVFMNRLKEWLKDIYINNDDEVRNAIVTGTLEHLFEREKWRVFFKDWLQEPLLVEAYNSALDWGLYHDKG